MRKKSAKYFSFVQNWNDFVREPEGRAEGELVWPPDGGNVSGLANVLLKVEDTKKTMRYHNINMISK